MGQCLQKEKPKAKNNKIYKKNESLMNEQQLCKEIEIISKQDSKFEVVRHTNISNDDFGLLKTLKCESVSCTSSYNTQLNKSKEENDNSILNETLADKNFDREFDTKAGNKEDEQSIVLINNDNIVGELLAFNQHNEEGFEKIEELINEYNNKISEESSKTKSNIISEIQLKNKCKYEREFRDGFNDDLILLNKCANVKKPALYFYKGSQPKKNEKQIGLSLVNQQITKQEISRKCKNLRTLKTDQVNSMIGKLATNQETIQESLNSKIQNEIGDCAKIATNFNELKVPSINCVGDKASNIISSKSIGLQHSKSKTVKRKKKSKNYLSSALDTKHSENIYKYPIINTNCFVKNLNRNDSSNIQIDDDDNYNVDELKNEKFIF